MKHIFSFLIIITCVVFLGIVAHHMFCVDKTKIVTIYENYRIPGKTVVNDTSYINVDGYRYANITVEFEQLQSSHPPVSLEVVFAHSPGGNLAAKEYFSVGLPRPEDFDVKARGVPLEERWHDQLRDTSSYIVRIPVMGPYMGFELFNHHDFERNLSVVVYLTQ
jgi:hypothetical protein